MLTTNSDFHYRKILSDGRTLEIKLPNSSLAENLICLKVAKHIVKVIEQYQRFLLVENFIKESMVKLKCRKK